MPSVFDVALIIPCYNEAARLPATFDKLTQYFNGHQPQGLSIVVVFVDDGSLDHTLATLTRFASTPQANFSVQLVTQPQNQGKGAAIKAGFLAVNAHKYGFTDADLSYGLAPFPEFIAALDETDVVIARRVDKEHDYSLGRRLISKAFSLLSRAFTGIQASDPQSGFKFFRQSVVQQIFPTLTQDRFAFDVECLAKIEAANFSVREIPLNFEHDQTSSVVASDGLRYGLDLLAIVDALPFVKRRFYTSLFGLALIISLTVYGWLIYYGYFFSDDFTWLWFGERVLAHPSEILTLKAGTFFSPVLNIYYAVMMGLFGPQAPYYFAANILIHVVTSTLGAIFVLDLTKSRLAATLSVALLALSGGAYEPVVWIGANMHSIVTLFILISLLGFDRFMTGRGWRFAGVGLLGALLAFCTKESSIILPVLLLTLYLIRRSEGQVKIKRSELSLITIAFSFITALYLAGQLILQEGGDTFAKNSYILSPTALLKIPFAIFDLFLPWKGAFDHLPAGAAPWFGLGLTALLAVMFWRLRHSAGVPLAIVLMFTGISPTLFFTTSVWWEPLASRYTYLPRLGAVLFLASVIAFYIRQNKARRVVHGFALFLILVSISQVAYMFKIVLTDYDYVYATGRTLAHASKLLHEPRTTGVYIHPDHPFKSNNAHLVAAMAIYADLREDQLTFLEVDQTAPLSNNKMLLYWRPNIQQYELTSHSDIFQHFPLP